MIYTRRKYHDKKLLLTFLLSLIDAFVFCQGRLDYSNAFMGIGADAGLAMANSVTASVGGVTGWDENFISLINRI